MSLTATKSPKDFRTRSRTTASFVTRDEGEGRELDRSQFYTHRAAFCRFEAGDVFRVGLGRVLLAIRYVHRVEEFLSRDTSCPHRNVGRVLAETDRAGLLRQEGARPPPGT